MRQLCCLLVLMLVFACTSPEKNLNPASVKKDASVLQSEVKKTATVVRSDVKKDIVETSKRSNLSSYQKELAMHISQRSSPHIYVTQPQAMLRSVIVIKFALDAKGRLVSHDILRSNKDREAEQTALASLIRAQDFPAPSVDWLRQGKLELIETWLFNSDGRFQLRTIALPQAGE
ncbi:MAG: hypothetical protein HY253_09310 [Burkholderiales bacterium]|nr:hypothetical protein [Burkholderiales bacterium]